jgi:hypothetical protein
MVYGIKPGADLAGVIFEPEKFLSVPACVFVGDGDVLRDSDLNQYPEVDAQQGMNRFERGTALAGGHAGGGRRARALDAIRVRASGPVRPFVWQLHEQRRSRSESGYLLVRCRAGPMIVDSTAGTRLYGMMLCT